ncbi:MAG: ABC transporter substrate-binding protein [Deltaproteobacteria bacterium]|nr:MAG: ABC transporter substrate-binding protein [Deltaproteobacteria bacterium]TMB14138.1 MAG: ABC transporter substrate-binding protein [Deltaproteobacteria bacterium]
MSLARRWSFSLLLLLAAACKDQSTEAPASGAGGTATASGGGATIGAALSLTGAAASYGALQRAGIQAGVEQVNGGGGPKLNVLIEDDASTKEQGITVFQKFINRDRVSAVLGPTLSNTASAADPLAQQAKVPVLAISNTAPTGITDIGNYIWRDSLTEAQVIPGAFKKAQEKLNFKTAGVLYGNDDVFTKAGYDVMQKALADLAVKVLGTQTFAKPDRDYNAQLTALIGLKPDVLVVSALADNASSIVAQARQRGWTGPILGGNGFNSPAFIKNAGAAAEGVMVGTSWNSLSQDPANQKFLEAMKKGGVNPDQFSAQAYTGVIILAEAIKQAGGKTGREDIVAGLAKVKDLDTPLGKFSFTPGRDAQHEPSVQQVKDGKFQIVQ